MGSLRLALSLIAVPRLFLTLFFFPLLVTLCIVYVQFIVTGVVLKVVDRSPEHLEAMTHHNEEFNFVRTIIYGSGARLGPIRVCRWTGSGSDEAPPDDACQPDRLDVAIVTEQPDTLDVDEYAELFNGNFERLHVCRSCRPDLTIHLRKGEVPDLNAYSIWSVSLLSLVGGNEKAKAHRLELRKERSRVEALLGRIKFHLSGAREPVLLSDLAVTIAVVLNIAAFVVITLWLALRAHRRVLDYFVRSGALLPMVAACGRTDFYSALWVLTALRVVCFLGASIPFFVEFYEGFVSGTDASSQFVASGDLLAVWVPALLVSLGLATVVASISDLTHRHSLLSFVYRYIPFLVSLVGQLLWSLSFIFEGGVPTLFRDLLMALPIVGIGPLLLAPIVAPRIEVLGIHLLLALFCAWIVLRSNARWFSAHLEDL